MIKQQVTPLRIILGALALGAVITQLVVVPRVASEYAGAYPEVAYLAAPYITAAAIAIFGFEVALLAAWQLLSAAASGETMTRRTKRWANVMAASLIFMAVIFAGVCFHAGSFANVGGPPMLFGIIFFLALVPVAFGLRTRVLDFFPGNDVDHHAPPLGHAA
jgi:hypothetical protein